MPQYEEPRRSLLAPALRVGALAGAGYLGARALPTAILNARKAKWLASTKVRAGKKAQRGFRSRFARRMKNKNVVSRYGLEGIPLGARAGARISKLGKRGAVGGALAGLGIESRLQARRRRQATFAEGR